jgi:hypothetical protein
MCNLLGAHRDVTIASHPAHWGFHESNVFKNERYWGDLTSLDRLIVFVRLYSACDHFRLVDGDAEALEAGRPRDFYEAFFSMMDRFAERSETPFWLTKLDPVLYARPRDLDRFLERVRQRYGLVGCVAVKRRIPDVLRSYLNMEGRADQRRTSRFRAPAFLLLETIRYVVHYAAIGRLARRERIPVIRYESLRGDTQKVLGTELERLGLPGSGIALDATESAPNSSVLYRTNVRALGPVAKVFFPYVVAPFARLLLPISRVVLRLREGVRPQRPPLYFKLRKLEAYPDEFRRELESNDERGLVSRLFPDTEKGER